MELRLVDRKFSRELSFPFPNDARRVKGFGIVKGNKLIGYDESDNEVEVSYMGDCLSQMKDHDGFCFLSVFYPETNECTTRSWNEMEFKAYIVNDNGKTVDKISS